jgi:hypothetical protein
MPQRTRLLIAEILTAILIALGSVSAEHIARYKLVALVSNPDSDLSTLRDFNIKEAAQIDAQLYFKAHHTKEYEKDYLGIGLAHALQHHLKGRVIDVYAFVFDTTCSALLRNR